jgi:hypothetical protein
MSLNGSTVDGASGTWKTHCVFEECSHGDGLLCACQRCRVHLTGCYLNGRYACLQGSALLG